MRLLRGVSKCVCVCVCGGGGVGYEISHCVLAFSVARPIILFKSFSAPSTVMMMSWVRLVSSEEVSFLISRWLSLSLLGTESVVLLFWLSLGRDWRGSVYVFSVSVVVFG